MSFILNALLLFWFQVPVPAVPLESPAAVPAGRPAVVVVGLVDDQKLVVENPKFTGFLETRDNDAILKYRENEFHGELSVRSISRIDFREYDKNRPFLLTVTLTNGQKLEVQSEGKEFLMVQGQTDFGNVTIKHPDPLVSGVRLRTKKPDRKRDLTIQYLEFPLPVT